MVETVRATVSDDFNPTAVAVTVVAAEVEEVAGAMTTGAVPEAAELSKRARIEAVVVAAVVIEPSVIPYTPLARLAMISLFASVMQAVVSSTPQLLAGFVPVPAT